MKFRSHAHESFWSRLACRRQRVLDDESVFALVADKFINEQWSPAQIAATQPDMGLSASTIYRWVDAGYAEMTNMELRSVDVQ